MPSLLLFLVMLVAPVLSAQAAPVQPQNGDLLFVTAARTGLSGAIHDATGNPLFGQLPETERVCMKHQADVMFELSVILGERIENFQSVALQLGGSQ